MPGLFSCPVQEIYQLFSSRTSLQFIEAVTYVTLSLSVTLTSSSLRDLRLLVGRVHMCELLYYSILYYIAQLKNAMTAPLN